MVHINEVANSKRGKAENVENENTLAQANYSGTSI